MRSEADVGVLYMAVISCTKFYNNQNIKLEHVYGVRDTNLKLAKRESRLEALADSFSTYTVYHTRRILFALEEQNKIQTC